MKNFARNFLLKSNAEDLNQLVALVKAGKLKVPVDCTVPFTDVPAGRMGRRCPYFFGWVGGSLHDKMLDGFMQKELKHDVVLSECNKCCGKKYPLENDQDVVAFLDAACARLSWQKAWAGHQQENCVSKCQVEPSQRACFRSQMLLFFAMDCFLCQFRRELFLCQLGRESTDLLTFKWSDKRGESWWEGFSLTHLMGKLLAIIVCVTALSSRLKREGVDSYWWALMISLPYKANLLETFI